MKSGWSSEEIHTSMAAMFVAKAELQWHTGSSLQQTLVSVRAAQPCSKAYPQPVSI